jgi:hypothetical protein
MIFLHFLIGLVVFAAAFTAIFAVFHLIGMAVKSKPGDIGLPVLGMLFVALMGFSLLASLGELILTNWH